MICCLNPQCQKPLNPDDANICQNCGASLETLRGRYQAIQLLGQGGFGRTYLALDTDRLNSRCVIKQFSPQVQGTKSLEKAVRLFNQEAVRLHELGEHPQIPTLLAYFEQDSYLYLVQQFIEGQSLLQEMKQNGAFSERQIRDVLADVLPVLRFVHRHQVIHRDITPMNILRRQSDDRLMLIDFGVAKQLSEESAGEAGTRIGTEGYAPMEQFRGGKAYPASDLYSLGATCLHLMTETRPDTLYDPLNGRWLWREHLQQEKGVVVSDQLAHILDNLLKDLVNERYQSADELMRDLNADSFLPTTKSTPPSAPPPPLPPPPVTPPPRIISAPPTPAPQAVNPANSKPPTSKPPTSKPPTSKPPIPAKPPVETAVTGKFSNTGSPVARSGATGRSSRCLLTLTAHSSWVTCVAASPNSALFASSSLDDTIKVWNLQTGEQLLNMTGHNRGINTIVISPDGKTLVSGSDDYTVRVWSFQSGALLGALTGHSRDVNAVAISPDGKLLVSGGEDRTIRFWSMSTGALLKTLAEVAGMIKTIAISPDGKTLASGGLDNKIKLWSLRTGEFIQSYAGHLNPVHAITFTPDGHTLITGSKDKTIRFWDIETGALIQTLTEHIRDVNALAVTPNGRMLISGSSDNTIKFWDLTTGKNLLTWTEHTDTVNALAITPDGRHLISGSSDKTVRVWQIPT